MLLHNFGSCAEILKRI